MTSANREFYRADGSDPMTEPPAPRVWRNCQNCQHAWITDNYGTPDIDCHLQAQNKDAPEWAWYMEAVEVKREPGSEAEQCPFFVEYVYIEEGDDKVIDLF